MKDKSILFRYFLFFSIIVFGNVAFAQFQVNGNAVDQGGNTYKLTDAVNSQFGAIWYKLQHNLTTTLDVQGQMYFGTDPAGADGICFVLQNNCLNAGTSGGGIGYAAMPGQSIAVEFDTYENSLATGSFDNHDPSYDHIAIERNGSVDHGSVDNLAGPVQMDASKPDVEDGAWYNFRILYDPSTFTLSVYFNGVFRLSYVYDLKTNIFAGDPYVYWGFTSATGGFNNEQKVKITAATYTINDATICTGPLQVHLPPLTNFTQKNVAISKTAVSSSDESGATIPSNVNDGNMGSRWSSAFSDPQWIYIDLLTVHDVDSIVLYWEAAYSSDYKIQRSDDGITWTDLFHETSGNGGKDFIPLTISNVRYIRMYSVLRATVWGSSLYEFQIWGKPKYLWTPNDGSINDIYSADPIFNPAVTTTYTVFIPDPCSGAVPYNMTITVDCPMPVEILSFNATDKGKSVYITWTTTFENNSHYFEILRSYDGINFISVGQVKAIGNSKTNTNYQFVDNDTYSGIAYYQLKEVDRDGRAQKSPIIEVVRNGNSKSFVVHPIFEDETLLQFPSHVDYVKYRIIDVLGREIYYREIIDPSKSEPIGKNLIPGVYILVVESNVSSESIKINKVR